MITHVKTHSATGPSYASGGDPGYTVVRWDCDGPCGMVGLEWDDRPHGSDGRLLEDAEEGDAAFCEDCANREEEE